MENIEHLNKTYKNWLLWSFLVPLVLLVFLGGTIIFISFFSNKIDNVLDFSDIGGVLFIIFFVIGMVASFIGCMIMSVYTTYKMFVEMHKNKIKPFLFFGLSPLIDIFIYCLTFFVFILFLILPLLIMLSIRKFWIENNVSYNLIFMKK